MLRMQPEPQPDPVPGYEQDEPLAPSPVVPAPAPAPAQPQPRVQAPAQHSVRPATATLARRDGLTIGAEDPSPNPALDLAASEGRGRRMELSPELASVLAIMWIATVAVAFFVGRGQFAGDGAERIASTVGTEVRAGDPSTPANAQPELIQPTGIISNGTMVLVLESVDRETAAALRHFEERAQQLNESALKARPKGLDPLFGVRRPRSANGLQLVYGKIDGGFGIAADDERGTRVYKGLEKIYPNRRWIDIGP